MESEPGMSRTHEGGIPRRGGEGGAIEPRAAAPASAGGTAGRNGGGAPGPGGLCPLAAALDAVAQSPSAPGGGAARRRARIFLTERLPLVAAFGPVLADFVYAGGLPSTPYSLLLHAAAGGVIVALAAHLRRTRRRLERVDGLRSALNEAIIHDLKNPMTSVMASISCVIGDGLDDERRRMLLRLALKGCRAQLVLIDTLADTSRFEQGELALRRQVSDTRRLLDASLDDVRGVAAQFGVGLRQARSSGLPGRLWADAELLSRVFVNLLLNALKYTPRGGSVSLGAGFEDDRFLFEIADTGSGIPPAHMKGLFKKYYRVEGRDQNTRRGSGLGLYFCRLVVEAHGGTIAAASGAGNGTKITFSIPQAPGLAGGLN